MEKTSEWPASLNKIALALTTIIMASGLALFIGMASKVEKLEAFVGTDGRRVTQTDLTNSMIAVDQGIKLWVLDTIEKRVPPQHLLDRIALIEQSVIELQKIAQQNTMALQRISDILDRLEKTQSRVESERANG